MKNRYVPRSRKEYHGEVVIKRETGEKRKGLQILEIDTTSKRRSP